MKRGRRLKVCYVVCYKHPDYIRTQTLTAALAKIESIELVIVRNKNRGVLRYLEVPFKVLAARLKYRPDIYIVGFRAHEVFGLVYPAMIGKPKIFDEMVNLHDWLVNEHKKVKKGSLTIKLIDAYMRWVMRKSDFVLADSDPHIKITEENYGLKPGKVKAVYMGANEELSYPRPDPRKKKGKFEVLFFGNVNPSTGIEAMLKAFGEVLNSPAGKNIHITFAGGQGKPEVLELIKNFSGNLKKPDGFTHMPWIDYREIPDYIAGSDLCLGGPFGKTGQSSRVISTKTYQFIAQAKPTVVGKNYAHKFFVDKKNCLMAEQSDGDSLAEAILWAYNHQEQLPVIGRAARKLYEDHFSIDITAKHLEVLIHELG